MAPQPTRLPPSRIFATSGWPFSSWSASCTEKRASLVVEPDHEAHRDPVLAHRVDERPAELAVLLRELERPAHRVDHAVERLLDLPDLLHPELPLLRILGADLEVADRRAGEVPGRALGEHGGLRDQVGARLEVRQLLAARARGPCRPSARPPRRRPRRAACGPRSRRGCRRRPPPPAAKPAAELRRPRSRGCRGSGTAAGSAGAGPRASSSEAGRPCPCPPSRRSATRSRRGRGTASASRTGSIIAPDIRCEPGLLPFSTSATGTSPSDSISFSSSASSCISRIAHASPPGPPPTITTPTSIRSSSGSVGAPTNSCAESTVGGNSIGAVAIRASPSWPCIASVSFGRILFRSPTIPRSENSKIGAFGSLLIATMFSERLHADLVLDRAGDAGRQVQLRRDRLAGLADLARRTGTSRRRPPRASRRPRRRARSRATRRARSPRPCRARGRRPRGCRRPRCSRRRRAARRARPSSPSSSAPRAGRPRPRPRPSRRPTRRSRTR